MVTVASLLDGGSYLSNISAWPRLPIEANPKGWLENFDAGRDREIAAHLLDAWIYVSDRELRKATSTLLQSLSVEVLGAGRPTGTQADEWAEFLARSVISVPLAAGEDLAASGYAFFRIARDLGFSEGQFLISGRLVHSYLTGPPRDLVLMDDLSGTGTQFVRSWKRRHRTTGGLEASLESLSESGRLGRVYFLPVVATTRALEAIRIACPEVNVRPAYILDATYGAADSNSRLVPSEMRDELTSLISRYTPRTLQNRGDFGYGDMGLTLAFEHNTPNNTLPLLAGPPNPASSNWTYLRSA